MLCASDIYLRSDHSRSCKVARSGSLLDPVSCPSQDGPAGSQSPRPWSPLAAPPSSRDQRPKRRAGGGDARYQ